MKRSASSLDVQESKLSNLLFSKSKDLTNKFKPEDDNDLDTELKPMWQDDDDEQYTNIHKEYSKGPAMEKLKQKYETLMGTPSWAKLKNKQRVEDDDEITKTVGHLMKKPKSINLQKDYLHFSRMPKINAETKNEGPLITAVEFHPKVSVSLVTGESGVVSLFAIDKDNTKLHSFKIKNFGTSSAHFTPDGSNVFISSTKSHSYCIYNLVKAVPELVSLPQAVIQSAIFKMSSDGKYIATSPGYDEIYILSAESRELLRSLKHNNIIVSVSFSSECSQLYCYTAEGQVVVWDLSTFRAVKKFFDHGCVTASVIACSPCGKLVATGSGEGIVNIYETEKLNVREPLPLKVISNLNTKITGLTFNPSTEILGAASGVFPNAVKLVHIPSYHVFPNFPERDYNLCQISSVSFSPNSGYMAMGNNKHSAYLYRLKYYKNY